MSLTTGETETQTQKSNWLEEKLVGRIKWFNNRQGYGFVTIMADEMNNFEDKDVFVHHTSIIVKEEQYKYLVQGEYVNFYLEPSKNKKHPYQAKQITGINGGLLMCETHFQSKRERNNPKDQIESEQEWTLNTEQNN